MTLFLLLLFVVAIVGVLMVWFIISDVKEKDCLNDFLSELRIKVNQGDADAHINSAACISSARSFPRTMPRH
jgi:hypothetical protein